MAEELEKTVIQAPELPKVVQGDGRYLMSLLNAYLKQASEQINLANGFTADEINPDTEGTVATPKHFTLTFNRVGGTFSWDYPSDITTVSSYEVRTDKNVGSNYNLLERTTDNKSYIMPNNYSGTIYLYAINSKGEYSNPSTLNYLKSRPDAPRDIALTTNNEGTLITFLEIPSDCIGANVYVNGEKNSTVDNVFLYEHDSDFRIKKVEIAYYDSFGEGEKAVINCDIPNVTGFYVEKNGANLDFYWEPVSVYGVKYVVKVGQDNDWNTGIELFTTKNAKHRYVYPNAGDFYFMIKACDEHNNYSETSAWYLLNADPEINKNIILDYKQSSIGYSGNKINLYYNALDDGLRMDSEASFGEYIIDVMLPQKYRARNWCEFKVTGKEDTSGLYLEDCNFLVDSDEAKRTFLNGIANELGNVAVTREIARYIGTTMSEDTIFLASLNGTITPDSGGTVEENINANTFETARFAQGLSVKALTKVEYEVTNGYTNNFVIMFWYKTTGNITDSVFLTLRKASESYYMALGYNKTLEYFYLIDNLGQELKIPMKITNKDYLLFGIAQNSDDRKLFIRSLSKNKTYETSGNYSAVGQFDLLFLYPKLI